MLETITRVGPLLCIKVKKETKFLGSKFVGGETGGNCRFI
jgi:hypothetical protein